MSGDGTLEPTTERIGGGRSAWATALLMSVAVASIIVLGIHGRSSVPAPVPAAESPRADAAGSPSARPTERSTPEPTRRPSWSDDGVSQPLREHAFAITAVIDGRFYFGLLRDFGVDHLRSSVRLSFPAPAEHAELQLVQLWTRQGGPNYVAIDRYDLEIEPLLRGGERRQVLVDERVEPKRGRLDAPWLVRRGYTISVLAEARVDHALLIADVVVGRQERESARLPLIRLLAQPDRPRSDRVLGHSWVAGY